VRAPAALLAVALLVLPAGVAPAAAQGADTVVVSLADAERRALEHNPLLERPRTEVELSRARHERAKGAGWLPELSLRNVWGPIPRQRGEFTETGVLISPDTAKGISDLRWFTQVDLEVLQPIYTFGKIRTLAEAAEHGVDASRASLASTRAEVRHQAEELYWGVLLGRELLRVADDVDARVQEADSTLQEQYEEGSATQNDLFKFRIFRYDVDRRRREAEDRLRMAREGLRAAMGLGEETPYRLETRVLEPRRVELDSLERYTALALEHRPRLAELRAGIAARSSLAEAERKERYPNLFAGGQFRLNQAPSRFDPRNPFWDDQTNFVRAGVVVGFEWNLNFMQHDDEAEISRLEARRLRDQLAPLRERIRIEVREAYLEASRAQADVADSEEALQASDNWLRAELQTFDIGIGDVEDVIDAFRANAEMRIEHLRKIAELNTALSALRRAVGTEIGTPNDSDEP